jgi:hypothetical protein
MHAVRTILYFLIWVLLFRASRRSQPPEGEAEQDDSTHTEVAPDGEKIIT